MTDTSIFIERFKAANEAGGSADAQLARFADSLGEAKLELQDRAHLYLEALADKAEKDPSSFHVSGAFVSVSTVEPDRTKPPERSIPYAHSRHVANLDRHKQNVFRDLKKIESIITKILGDLGKAIAVGGGTLENYGISIIYTG